MTIADFRRISTALAGGTAVVAPAIFFPAPGVAATTSCGGYAGAVEVVDGVCEYVFDEAGTYTFTAPETVSKVAAILVGGGGGGFVYEGFALAYAGGGGDVIYVDDISGETQIVVGAGGAPGNDGELGSAGTETRIGDGDPARPGQPGSNFSSSGNENLAGPFSCCFLSGGGAGGNGDGAQGGPGRAASAVTDVDNDLFPVVVNEIKFGPGGSVVDPNGNLLEEPEITETSFRPTGVSPDLVPGAGGNVVVSLDPISASATAGQDGAVVIRWAGTADDDSNGEDDEALPDTGAAVTPWALVGALSAVSAGVAAISRRPVTRT